jgi:hypothetical protein
LFGFLAGKGKEMMIVKIMAMYFFIVLYRDFLIIELKCKIVKKSGIEEKKPGCNQPGSQKCPEQDSNLHTVTGTSPSSWRVYQFHHLGGRKGLKP